MGKCSTPTAFGQRSRLPTRAAAGCGWARANRAGTASSWSTASRSARIAWRESGGNPRAQNLGNTPGRKPSVERSFGLWQINTLANRQYDETSLMDPSYNARAAYELSHQGTSWRPWNLP